MRPFQRRCGCDGGVKGTGSTTGEAGIAECGVPSLEAKSGVMQKGFQDKSGMTIDLKEVDSPKMNMCDFIHVR